MMKDRNKADHDIHAHTMGGHRTANRISLRQPGAHQINEQDRDVTLPYAQHYEWHCAVRANAACQRSRGSVGSSGTAIRLRGRSWHVLKATGGFFSPSVDQKHFRRKIVRYTAAKHPRKRLTGRGQQFEGSSERSTCIMHDQATTMRMQIRNGAHVKACT